MGVFGKSFFSFPPGDPEEPGFAQDGNRSLKEAHSAGKEISEFLSQYDEETITSLDGAKYQVMAQREGSDSSSSWWAPSLNLKENKLTIAQGSITAPWDDRDSGDHGTNNGKHYHPKNAYRHFTFPATEQSVGEGNNYFFLRGSFRELYANTAGPPAYTVFQYYIASASDFSLVKSGSSPDSDGSVFLSDSLTDIHQYLGHYVIADGKVTDHKWRIGHTIDLRQVSTTTSEETGTSGAPANPNG